MLINLRVNPLLSRSKYLKETSKWLSHSQETRKSLKLKSTKFLR